MRYTKEEFKDKYGVDYDDYEFDKVDYRENARKVMKVWKCEVCGKSEGDVYKYSGWHKMRNSLLVHHLDNSKPSDPDYHRYNHPLNLEVLCFCCHRRVHALVNSISEETRYKMREAHLGEKNHFYGKSHTEEIKSRLSELQKDGGFGTGYKHTEDHKNYMKDKMNGSKFYNDGVRNYRMLEGWDIPSHYKLGMVKRSKKNIKEVINENKINQQNKS